MPRAIRRPKTAAARALRSAGVIRPERLGLPQGQPELIDAIARALRLRQLDLRREERVLPGVHGRLETGEERDVIDHACPPVVRLLLLGDVVRSAGLGLEEFVPRHRIPVLGVLHESFVQRDVGLVLFLEELRSRLVDERLLCVDLRRQ